MEDRQENAKYDATTEADVQVNFDVRVKRQDCSTPLE